jgi:hypothetical protein
LRQCLQFVDNAFAHLLQLLSSPAGEQQVCSLMGLCPPPAPSAMQSRQMYVTNQPHQSNNHDAEVLARAPPPPEFWTNALNRGTVFVLCYSPHEPRKNSTMQHVHRH